MKKIIFLLLILTATKNVFSQVNVRGFNQTATRTSEILQILRKPVIYDSLSVKGSPYEYNTFFYGYVYDKEKMIANLPLRYNIYNDEFQVRVDVNQIDGLTFNENYRIEIYNNTYIPLYYDFKNKLNLKGYFSVLYNGEHKLLLKKRKIYIPAKPPKNSLSPGFPARFIDSDDFFILLKNSNKPKIIKNRKSFISLFQEDVQDELTKFIKDNNISFKNGDDLNALFNFINSEL